jgi:hypothetical protein
MTDFPTTDEMIGNLVASFEPEPEEFTDLSIAENEQGHRQEGEEHQPTVMVESDGTETIIGADQPKQDEPVSTDRETELAAQVEQLRTESAGRLNEMVEMRKTTKEQGDNVEAMRKMMLEDVNVKRQAALTAKEAEVYGEDTIADPAVRAIRDDNARTRDMIRRQTEREEHQRQEATKASEDQAVVQAHQKRVVDHAAQGYEAAVAAHTDFEEAFEYSKKARLGIYRARGVPEAELSSIIQIEEYQLANEAMLKGQSTAEKSYELAVSLGWKPKVAGPVPVADQTIGVMDSLDKMREGLKTTTLTKSQNGRGDKSRISREQFFQQYAKHERAAILSDPVKWKQLGTTGYVDI